MSEWITDSQDEQSLEDFFRDADQVHIPVFQREYVWKKKEFDDLLEDIRVIREGIEDTQFLGAIVGYERPRPRDVVGRMRALDIVDGQQRLLTLYLFVMAIAKITSEMDETLAAEIVQDYLLLPNRRGLKVNTRIVPSYSDRTQFWVLWRFLRESEGLEEAFEDNDPTPPPRGDEATEGPLRKQYGRIRRHLDRNLPSSSAPRLRELKELLNIIVRQLTFVHLKLNDASSAPKIFERLNYRGKRVGIVDLVRNEVISRVSDDPKAAVRVFEHVWKPFEDSFQGRAGYFFFPYCLIHDPNTKKSELFRELRVIWDGLEGPEEIVEHMEPYHQPFMAVDQGVPAYEETEVNLRLDRLDRLNRPSSVYPFLMKLLFEYEQERTDTDTCTTILDLVESFLVRRGILGYEPTGLHALFKGLWEDIDGDPEVAAVGREIRRRTTIQWPDDEEVRQAVMNRELSSARIMSYLADERDRALPGDNPSDEPTLEHILPETPKEGGAWLERFTEDQHKILKDLWANIIPLSAPLNESLQRGPYEAKKKRYKNESMFVTPRAVADEWKDWTPESVRERGEVLADWAVKRWPYGPDHPVFEED